MDMSRELRSVVIESGEMAESLFERVNEGYREGTVSSCTMPSSSKFCQEFWNQKVFFDTYLQPQFFLLKETINLPMIDRYPVFSNCIWNNF